MSTLTKRTRIVNSVKPYQDVIKSPLSPTLHPTMENFAEAFHSSKILSLYGTSILITGSLPSRC